MRNLLKTLCLGMLYTLGGCSGSSDFAGSGSGPYVGGSTGGGNAEPPNGGPAVQAGTLTAGEYDDHLNPSLYQDYLTDMLQGDALNLPYVDIASKIIIRVTDVDDLPVAAARITAEVEGVEVMSVTTAANGEAYIYLGLDSLPDTFDLVVSHSGGPLETISEVSLEEIGTNGGLDIAIPSSVAKEGELDLMLVIDTTSSMRDELDFLQEELHAIIDRIVANHTDLSIRAGLVVYRDIGDSYVTREFELTNDIASLQSNLSLQTASGGGDYPEAMEKGLQKALAADWRQNSTKIMLLVADAPPKDKDIAEAWSVVLDARERQIHILPVAASSSGPVTEFLMRAMAVATQSRYLFLTDDSGVGNTHDEPTVDCYVVTRLDNAIIRAIDSLVTGDRVFPLGEEIVRREGNYDNGFCEPEMQ